MSDLFDDVRARRVREADARLALLENQARDLQARAASAANEIAAIRKDLNPTTKEDGDADATG